MGKSTNNKIKDDDQEDLEMDEFTLLSPTAVPETTRKTFQDMKVIYKYLSHHYVLKRSVVFIVGQDFDSVFYKEKAHQYVKEFFESMRPSDNFGYLSLGSINNEIMLEPISRNTKTKQSFLEDLIKNAKESQLFSSKS